MQFRKLGYLVLSPVKSLEFHDFCGYITLTVKSKLEKWKRAHAGSLPPPPRLSYCMFSTIVPPLLTWILLLIYLCTGAEGGLEMYDINTDSSAYDSSASNWSQDWSWDPVCSPAVLAVQWCHFNSVDVMSIQLRRWCHFKQMPLARELTTLKSSWMWNKLKTQKCDSVWFEFETIWEET